MTCHDARELLSALLDEALPASERQGLDAHLAGCPECRRELDRLRETVALLGRVPPVHAPAGFVDRVMAEVYRPSRARRAVDALFRPLRVKLPLEAAAVLLVGVSALYVYQRTPEVRELARQESRESSPAPAVTPSAPREAGEPSRFRDLASDAKRAPAEQGAAREEARQTPPAVGPPAPAPSPAPRGNVQEAPAVKPEAMRGSRPESMGSSKSPESKVTPQPKAKLEKEAQVERRPDAFGGAGTPSAPGKVAQSPEPSPSRDAAGVTAGAAPSSADPAPPAEARDRVGGVAAPPARPYGSEADDARSTAKSQAAARLTRAVDASGRLAVPAREPAEAALDTLLGRLGATRVARRLEGAPGMVLIDVVVPGARYRELLEGLGRIGRWVTEYEVTTLPPQVRVEIALIVEP